MAAEAISALSLPANSEARAIIGGFFNLIQQTHLAGGDHQLFGFLLSPATEALAARGSKLQAIAPTEIFIAYIKCALLAGFVFTLPVSFWQIWAFIAPGLYDTCLLYTSPSPRD